MAVSSISSKQKWLFLLLLLVLFSNFAVYRLPAIPLPQDANGVVIGSLLDLSIVAPLLILSITRKKGYTVKRFFTFMVLGLVAARFIIPAEHFAPFKFVPFLAIGFEVVILIAEIGLLLLLAKHLPGILRELKKENLNGLFAFPAIVRERVSSHPIISIISAEMLMFYYAFASWKRKPIIGESTFTLHQKTSYIAFNIMLIHAIVLETFGLHWWLHDQSILLSVILLILNVYSILFFIGDIQAVRLNPLKLNRNYMQVSLGLMKRMEIPYSNIENILWEEKAATFSLKQRGTIDFIAKDFEDVKPQCILQLKRPIKAVMFLGFEKEFHTVALRVDELSRFRQQLEHKVNEKSSRE